jgi:hypothetical protein
MRELVSRLLWRMARRIKHGGMGLQPPDAERASKYWSFKNLKNSFRRSVRRCPRAAIARRRVVRPARRAARAVAGAPALRRAPATLAVEPQCIGVDNG